MEIWVKSDVLTGNVNTVHSQIQSKAKPLSLHSQRRSRDQLQATLLLRSLLLLFCKVQERAPTSPLGFFSGHSQVSPEKSTPIGPGFPVQLAIGQNDISHKEGLYQSM